MSITDELTAHGDEIAKATGGKLTVECWVWVSIKDGKPTSIFRVVIGETGSDVGLGHGTDIETAKQKALEQWRAYGAPTDRYDAELYSLKLKASNLGFTLIANPHTKLEDMR